MTTLLLTLGTVFAQSAEQPAEEGAPLTKAPSIATYVEAVYPEAALAEGLEATVRLQIELSETGEVLQVQIAEPAGHGFDEAAVDAVLDMLFTPAETAEGPVPVLFTFDYGFRLDTIQEEAPPEPILSVEGVVRQMATRRLVEGARVVDIDTEQTVVTNAQGAFKLMDLPEGPRTLRIVHADHQTETFEISVVDGEVATLDIWIRPRGLRTGELVAQYDRPKVEVTRRTIQIEEIRRIPGTFGDPVKVIQTLPGAARTPFGTGLLVIRGSNPEDSGVYIDGVRIPIIYHLTGTTSVLQPELVESVDYYPGGYGVGFGRTMGGTIDVRTKQTVSDQPKISWGTDVLDSQVLYEGPVGKKKKQRLVVGARRSYIDALLPLFLKDTGLSIKPRYWDYQIKWLPTGDGDDGWSVFVYGFDDLLRVSTPDDVAQGSDADTQGDLRTQYNSQRMIVRWSKELSDRLRLTLSPSLGYDNTYFGVGDAFFVDTANWLLQLRAGAEWTLNPHLELRPGVDWVGAQYAFDFRTAVRITDINDPLAEREAIGFDGNGWIGSPDAHLTAIVRPLADTEKWLISPGVRALPMFLREGGSIAQPTEGEPPAFLTAVDARIATRLMLSDSFTAKASSGTYHQPPQPQELIGVGTRSSVGFERAWASSAGVEHKVSPAISYDIEAFYKRLDRLIVFDESWTGFGSNPFINEGLGRAYGVEVLARHNPTGNFFGWISYTLSYGNRAEDPTCLNRASNASESFWGTGRCWSPFDYDQRHILSAQAGYDLPFDLGISAQIQYVTGNPTDTYDSGIYDADGDFYNPIQIGQNNDERLPPYMQTSIRLDRRWTFRRWQLDGYLDLLNVVRGVNPEFVQYNQNYTESAYVRGLPFIPNLGLEARFFR